MEVSRCAEDSPGRLKRAKGLQAWRIVCIKGSYMK